MLKVIGNILRLSAPLLLIGCVSSEERTASQAEEDAAKCRGYGFEQGTTEFSECLQRVDLHREQIAQDYYNTVVSPYSQAQFGKMGSY
jgi:hypothetical protein